MSHRRLSKRKKDLIRAHNDFWREGMRRERGMSGRMPGLEKCSQDFIGSCAFPRNRSGSR